MSDTFLKRLNEVRAQASFRHDAVVDVLSDELARKMLDSQRPIAYRREWATRASTSAYYAVTVFNPSDIALTFTHLSVVITPGWASDYAQDQINTALAARDRDWPSYTGPDVTLVPNGDTTIRLDFPIPSSAPVGFKFIGLGLLWGPHPSPDAHYYSVGQFFTLKY